MKNKTYKFAFLLGLLLLGGVLVGGVGGVRGVWVGESWAQTTVTRSERMVQVRGEWYYIHRVGRGETLHSIARAYETDVEAIRRINHLPGDQVRRRQRLLVPTVREDMGGRYPMIIEGGQQQRQQQQQGGIIIEQDTVPETIVEQEAQGRGRLAARLRPFDQYGVLRIALLLPMGDADTEQERLRGQDFADYYRGTLLGLEALKQEGISTHLQVINTDSSADKVQSEIRQGKLSGAQLIIGPVYPEAFAVAAAYAGEQGIPIVSPLGSVGEEDNPFVFEAAPPRELMYDKLFRLFGQDYLMGEDSTARLRNTLIIRHAEWADSAVLGQVEQAFVGRLGNVHTVDYQPIQGNKTRSEEIDNRLMTLLDREAENVIFVPVSRESAVEEVLSRLSSIQIREHDRYRITVVGTSQWWRFEGLNLDLYFRLQVHYPTSYHADRTEPLVADFYRAYIEAFGSVPTSFAMRGYDVVKYFGSALRHFGVDMPSGVSAGNNGGYRPGLLQVRYVYLNEGIGMGGKYRNLNWPVVHFRPGYTIRVK